ncbi:FeoA family protein [Methanococcus vannielii SB]|jgi:ferrous iron transport protein A|uniref:FeoA family protein n=1 Tax=Methanococcus vannielii (strain ATCC 35089 / DSM 1224 / JCM 13029 / OCM 148 / SB) TaxID=406327 RepID=A6URG7_METVS|nr:FeoA family protein [Methanococcus vannielii]ABR55089.1 FeoA family protein [Methanococcus vannielii SB]
MKSDTLKNETILLIDLPHGQKGIILEQYGNQFLASLGLRKGKIIQLVAKQIYGGPLVCSIDDRKIAIGKDIAKLIQVKPFIA